MEHEEESGFINPEKLIKNPQVRRVAKTIIDGDIDNSVQPSPQIKEVQNVIHNEYLNYGSTVKVEFESSGRFGNPAILVLKDYSARHIHDLVTSKEEDIFETLVGILNQCVVEPAGFDVGNLTNDEFLEVMIGMKLAFDNSTYTHRWIHNIDNCQGKVSEYDEKKISEFQIDLSQVKMTSIEESDDKIKEFYRSKLQEFSEEQFKAYLMTKYNREMESTIDEEIDKVKIQEPFLIKGYDCDYEFNLIRVKDLLLAHKMASREINHKIRVEKNKPIKQDQNRDANIQEKEDRLDKLNREKGQKILSYAQAFSLRFVRRNGNRIPLDTPDQKIKEYNNMPRAVVINYLKAIETIEYGVNHEVDMVCEHCNGTERGYLQRIITPLDLIPLSNDKNNSTSRNVRQSSGFDFYF
jgi:hypothetical protein